MTRLTSAEVSLTVDLCFTHWLSCFHCPWPLTLVSHEKCVPRSTIKAGNAASSPSPSHSTSSRDFLHFYGSGDGVQRISQDRYNGLFIHLKNWLKQSCKACGFAFSNLSPLNGFFLRILLGLPQGRWQFRGTCSSTLLWLWLFAS